MKIELKTLVCISLVFIYVLAITPISALSNEKNIVDTGTDCIHEPNSTIIFLDELQVALPRGLDLFSFGLDRDYKDVVILRYYPWTDPKLNLGIVVRESEEPQKWSLPKGAVLINNHNLPISDSWFVYLTTNSSATDKLTAGFYNQNFHLMVMAPEPMECLRQLVSTNARLQR